MRWILVTAATLWLVSPAAAQTATPTPLCGAAPRTGCRTPVLPAEGQFIVKNATPDDRDLLRWEWWEGAATSMIDFGDPVTSTRYGFCIYDYVGGVPALVWSAEIPAGGTCGGRPCWTATSLTFVYKDRLVANHGLKRIRLRPGGDGEARITVSGKRANLMPVTPLAQDALVRVQMANDLGNCWEANYSPPADNSDAKFRDAND